MTGPREVGSVAPVASTKDGTFVKRTLDTRRASTSQRATQARRPDGTSTVTGVSVPVIGRTPLSSAQVTSAIVPCPQAVE